MKKPRVRLQDIADATGFSMNTVSLALRDSPRIGKKTHELIRTEAKRLNYFPNRVARSLAGHHSNMVGLILTDITNPILTLAAQTAERKLAQAGYGMMFAGSDMSIEGEKKALQWFQSYQVDGILIYPADHSQLEHIKTVANSGLPVILLANLPDSGLEIVTVDDRIGAYRAVQHLISRGHRNIAFLDAGYEIRNTEKSDGAREAMAEAGLPPDALTIIHPGGNSSATGYETMQRIDVRNAGYTAIFTSTDSLAIGVLRWCQTHGFSVPEDLAIMGYDNTESSAFRSQPLSTVHYAADEVSKLAVDRLMEIINSPWKGEMEPMVKSIEPDIVIRSTT